MCPRTPGGAAPILSSRSHTRSRTACLARSTSPVDMTVTPAWAHQPDEPIVDLLHDPLVAPRAHFAGDLIDDVEATSAARMFDDVDRLVHSLRSHVEVA